MSPTSYQTAPPRDIYFVLSAVLADCSSIIPYSPGDVKRFHRFFCHSYLVNGVSVSGGNSRPGENARITIRQNDVLASMGNNNLEPLYVIDGYIYPTEVKVGSSIENLGATAFNNLDPSMIEGISVLKDAAAAVYGARAANGVI